MSHQHWNGGGYLAGNWQQNCSISFNKNIIEHFDRDRYSLVNINLVAQAVPRSTCIMICDVIQDGPVLLSINNKHIYDPLVNLCRHLNNLLDVIQKTYGSYTPENAPHRQTKLLDIMDWSCKWKVFKTCFVGIYKFKAQRPWNRKIQNNLKRNDNIYQQIFIAYGKMKTSKEKLQYDEGYIP